MILKKNKNKRTSMIQVISAKELKRTVEGILEISNQDG